MLVITEIVLVRAYLLNKDQRKAIKTYMSNPSNAMPGGIRQIRHRLKHMDLNEIAEDVILLRRLNEMVVPVGRKSLEVAAKFTVRQKTDDNVKAKLSVKSSKYDHIIDSFMGGEHEVVKVEALDISTGNLVNQLNRRIKNRDLQNIGASAREGVAYLEKVKK